MNKNEFDLAARAWLEDGPNRMSDRAVLSAFETIHTTRQRRALRPAWRTPAVSIFARVAVAAVLVIAVGLLAGNLIRRQPDLPSVGGLPTPSPTAELMPGATPSPSATGSAEFPALTSNFVSPTNGFSFGYIDRGGLKPAKVPWDPVTQPRPDASGALDDPFDVVETGYGAVFKGASTAIPDGVSIDAWVDEYLWPRACGIPRSEQAEITIDGRAGKIVECANHIEATLVAGGRLYLFQLLHSRSDARAFFDAFVATIRLTPEDAAVPTSSP
jgi:hypothetical protein